MEKIKSFILKYKVEIIIFLACYIINVIFSLSMGYPIISDEYNIMSEGMFLGGNAIPSSAYNTVPNKNYYGFGFAILYGFLSHFIINMHSMYILVLCFNAFFLSFVPVIAYKICAELKMEKKFSFIVSTLIGFYPAYFIYAKYALNETFLVFLLWIILYLLIKLYSSKHYSHKTILSIMIGSLSMFAYAVHGRGLALLAVSFLLVIFYSVFCNEKNKNKLFIVIAYLCSVILFYFMNSVVKGIISEQFLGVDASTMANTAENILNVSFFKMLFGNNASEIIIGLLGQFWYIVCATFGFVILSIIFYCKIIKKYIKQKKFEVSDPMLIIGTFTIGTFLSTLLISVLFFANLYVTNGMIRGEYWIYGRYNEINCGLLIFFSLICLYKYSLNKKNLIVCLVILFSVLGIVYIIIPNRILQLENPSLSYTMVPSIIPFSGSSIYIKPTLDDYKKLTLIIFIISLFQLGMFYKNKKKVALIFLSSVFIYSSVFSFIEFVHPVSLEKRNGIAELEKIGNNSDFSSMCNGVYVLNMSVPIIRVPFVFPNNEVRFLNRQNKGIMELANVKENSIILSNIDEELDIYFNDVYLVGKFNDIYMWAYGTKMVDYFKNESFKINNRLSDNGKISVVNANLIVPKERIFKVSSLYASFRYNLQADANSIITSNKVSLAINGNLSLNKLYMNHGSMDLTFVGENIKNTTISFDSEVIEVTNIEIIDHTRVKYNIIVKSFIEELKISIENNSQNAAEFIELHIEDKGHPIFYE